MRYDHTKDHRTRQDKTTRGHGDASTTVPLSPHLQCRYSDKQINHIHFIQLNILIRGGTGNEFGQVPNPGTRSLVPGRIRVVAGSGYFNM